MAWIIKANPGCRFITAYHNREYSCHGCIFSIFLCSAEYYLGDLLRLWGMEARMLACPIPEPALVEAVRGLRPEDDPEEWPRRLDTTIYLISIYATSVYTVKD